MPQAQQRQVAVPAKKQSGVRGGLLLLGLVLVVASGGAFWYVLRTVDERQEYLVTVRTIERWEIANASDFTVVEAHVGDANALPVEFGDLVFGKWATGRIPAGTIVSPGMFETPPLSGDEESQKVLIEVSLPAGEAPLGDLKAGDRVALFGAEEAGLEGVEPEVGLIGVLTLENVQGDQLIYLVSPEEARAIQDTVDRYAASANRRIWKLGSTLSAGQLIDLYGASRSSPPAAEDLFADPGAADAPADGS